MRNRDYTPTAPREQQLRRRGAGGAAAYLRYVAEVAVPAVSSRYRLDPGAG